MSERLLLFSSDCHAGARTDLYAEYIDPQYKLEIDEFISYERKRIEGLRKDEDDSESERALRLDYERRAIYATQLDKRVAALEDDGYVGEVLYPDGGFGNRIPFSTGFGSVAGFSAEHHAAALRAYNRWLGETLTPGRQVGLVLVQLVDVDEAVRTVEGARGLGLGGVMPHWDGIEVPELFTAAFDPIWSACSREGLAVHFHSGSGIPARMYKGTSRESGLVGKLENLFWSRRALWHFVMGGVLEKHPDLNIVFAETWADWLPRTVAYMDWMWSGIGDTELKARVPRRPSEYWTRQGYVGAHTPSLAETHLRHDIGIDNLMFGTDFPHSGSPWGVANEFHRATLGAANVPVDEARKLLGENAVRLYGLDRDALAKVAERVGPTAHDVLRPADDADISRLPPFIYSKVTRPPSSL